jgi:dsDNA-specific endonuclease/ATPase MutS2
VNKKDKLKSEATKHLEELREQKKKQQRVQDMLDKCYLRQEALYVVEEQHMVMHGRAIIANGPKFELHKWNKRPTLAVNVES